jgi:hypothetical protein
MIASKGATMQNSKSGSATYALPSHAELVRRAGPGATRVETRVRLGKTDETCAEIRLHGWQCAYRMPSDYPDFAEATKVLRAASASGETVALVVDPVRFVILSVDVVKRAPESPASSA